MMKGSILKTSSHLLLSFWDLWKTGFAEHQGSCSSDLDVLSPFYSTGPNKKAAVSSNVGKCDVFIWVCGINLTPLCTVRPGAILSLQTTSLLVLNMHSESSHVTECGV